MDKEELRLEKENLKATKEILQTKIDSVSLLSNKLENSFKADNEAYLKGLRDMNLNEMKEEVEFELDFQQRSLTNLTNEIDEQKKLIDVYNRMKDNPYFARIDIKLNDSKNLEKYYLGVHSVTNNENEFIVLDWRSPIAGLFYDYEVGDAKIKTDLQETPCKLKNKRQFKIEKGELEYYFDTNITIDDEILKNALAKSSSTKMKSIVQTIQKEQNEIIRSHENDSILVQGIAGSGKTAIALHRIAYLLYKMKGKISSNNIAMLSPNNAFSTYISSVLPDLAEEDIKKYQLDYILKSDLKKFAICEEKFEQIERVIKSGNAKEYEFKTSFEFYEKLKQFCFEKITNSFNSCDFEIMGLKINGDAVNKLYYKSYSEQDIFTRICWIGEHIISKYFYQIKNVYKLKMIRQDLFTKLYSMIKIKNCVKLYMQFLESLNLKLSLINNKVKNEDAYPILFIRYHIYGAKQYKEIKHLFIDEVQDYSPVQLAIIKYLFDCPVTMLGDFKQSINVKSIKSKFAELKELFNDNLKLVELTKSYRPTVEIANLFNYIGDIKAQVVSRHGDMPEYLKISEKNDITILSKQIKELKKQFNSVAIITKTLKQSKELYEKLKNAVDCELIDDSSDSYTNTTCILSAFNSKGMEFDAVIAYDCSKENYNSKMDNNLLYIVMSRALHAIKILSKGDLTPKLSDYFALEEGRK